MTQKQVRVTFLPPFREFSEKRDFYINFQNKETFRDLIHKLIKEFGPKFEETLLNKEQKIHEWISVMMDGTTISTREDSGFSLPLSNQQEFVFCAFMSGGIHIKESRKLSIYG